MEKKKPTKQAKKVFKDTNNSGKRPKRLCIPKTIKKVRDETDEDRGRTQQLVSYFESRDFNLVGEIIDIYRNGHLSPGQKLRILLDLMPYVYPKLKNIETNEQNISSQNIIQVIYTNQEIKTEEGEDLNMENNINNL